MNIIIESFTKFINRSQTPSRETKHKVPYEVLVETSIIVLESKGHCFSNMCTACPYPKDKHRFCQQPPENKLEYVVEWIRRNTPNLPEDKIYLLLEYLL